MPIIQNNKSYYVMWTTNGKDVHDGIFQAANKTELIMSQMAQDHKIINLIELYSEQKRDSKHPYGFDILMG